MLHSSLFLTSVHSFLSSHLFRFFFKSLSFLFYPLIRFLNLSTYLRPDCLSNKVFFHLSFVSLCTCTVSSLRFYFLISFHFFSFIYIVIHISHIPYRTWSPRFFSRCGLLQIQVVTKKHCYSVWNT